MWYDINGETSGREWLGDLSIIPGLLERSAQMKGRPGRDDLVQSLGQKANPALGQWWTSVSDAGPPLAQSWDEVSRGFLGRFLVSLQGRYSRVI